MPLDRTTRITKEDGSALDKLTGRRAVFDSGETTVTLYKYTTANIKVTVTDLDLIMLNNEDKEKEDMLSLSFKNTGKWNATDF